MYGNYQTDSSTMSRELAGVSKVFADYVDEQDNKITLLSQQLEEVKTLLAAGKQGKGKGKLGQCTGEEGGECPF